MNDETAVIALVVCTAIWLAGTLVVRALDTWDRWWHP